MLKTSNLGLCFPAYHGSRVSKSTQSRQGTRAACLASVDALSRHALEYGGFCSTCHGIHHLHSCPGAVEAAKELASLLDLHQRVDFDTVAACPELSTDFMWTRGPGRMLGVLVCVDQVGKCWVLKAFSGQMTGLWSVEGWAGPVAGVTSAHALYCDFRSLTEGLGRRLTGLQCILDAELQQQHHATNDTSPSPASSSREQPDGRAVQVEVALQPSSQYQEQHKKRSKQRAKRHAPTSPSAVAAAALALGTLSNTSPGAMAAAEILRLVELRRTLSRHLMQVVQRSYCSFDVAGRPLQLLQVSSRRSMRCRAAWQSTD